ncbi:hypothetical protein THOM_0652 [Trachipleistophora hominis]|uniref:Uncharacterized protein n=1 Tax=Trachipleistophora hominis TaxID=72359 RepID=L7JYF5_TRAHO|nr:hypothetical protein THOM_0652 [Trachipleistophora hominis]
MFIAHALLHFFILVSLIRCRERQKQEEDVKDQSGSVDNLDKNATCQTYSIEMVEEDKNLTGINPEDTEVFQEAKRNGLVPLMSYTMFGTPKAINLNQLLPSNLNALSQTLITNMGNANNDSSSSSPSFTFLGGVIAKTMDKGGSDDDKDKDDKDKDDKDKDDKDKKNEPSKEEGGKGKSGKGQGGAKLIQGMPSLREGLADRDEASEALLMPKEE